MSEELYTQLTQIQNKIQDKLQSIEKDGEKSVYHMLGALIDECHQLLRKVEETAQLSTYQEILLCELPEGEAIIEETLQILEESIDLPFKLLTSKKVYEMIEDQMADLDDWIETLNENLDETTYSFSYIESWDIGIFLENR